MAGMRSLRDAFVEGIKDLYDAELQLIKALPKMAKAAANEELRSAIESHLEETRTQVNRLENVFSLLEMRPKRKHCAGIAGIIEEASETLKEVAPDEVLDARIIAGGQRAEHYEMAAYGTVIAWAIVLERTEVGSLLQQNLEEEYAADQKLSDLADGGINEAAAAEADEDVEEEPSALGRTGRSAPHKA
jgi:ferritin-like metal-binding protein YciE